MEKWKNKGGHWPFLFGRLLIFKFHRLLFINVQVIWYQYQLMLNFYGIHKIDIHIVCTKKIS